MKTNQLIGILIGLIIGLVGGYFLFTSEDGKSPHTHTTGDSEAEAIWTCSMHPQIRQSEPGLCPICEMELIPAGTSKSQDPLVFEMTNEAARLANIRTETVGFSTGESTPLLTLTGKVQADERRAASQVAHVPGRIEKLHVSFAGESVRTGQALAELYSPELITAQREFLEARKFADSNPALLEAARSKLRYWKVPDSLIENLESTGTIRETFTMRADADGIVEDRLVAVGDYVNRGEPLFELIDLDRVWILFDVYEEKLSAVNPGQQISFTTPAVPGRTFETTITFIDPWIDPVTRVARVRGETSNPNGLLKPNMLVRGTVRQETRTEGVLRIPRTAVLWTGRKSVVYVRVPDTEQPVFAYREIELGQQVGDQYEVLSGLDAGEEVVAKGVFMVDAAAQLNNQQSMINDLLADDEPEETGPDYRELTPPSFRQELATVVRPYLQLKDAFVATDPNDAARAATNLIETLREVSGSTLPREVRDWWQKQRGDMIAHTSRISQSENVEEQRRQFGFLSNLLINALQAVGGTGEVLYVQHCPMAFNDEGADWIAAEQEINNPYFGDKMLRCGLVEVEIPSANQ